MSLLYLIRHPQTHVDLSQPTADWALSAAGEAQVAALLDAPFWPTVTAIYASPEPKALHPAQAAGARYDRPVTAIPALGEVDRGAVPLPDQASYQAAVQAFFTWPDVSSHGWERAADALARFQRAVALLLARHPVADSLALVAHGLVLSLYMAALRHEAPTLDRWRALGFCSVAAVARPHLDPLTDFLPAPYDGLPLPKDSTP